MTYLDFEAAKAACTSVEQVLGVLREDGEPVYRPVPVTISEEEINHLAFEIRYGRPMSDVEEFFGQAVEGLVHS